MNKMRLWWRILISFTLYSCGYSSHAQQLTQTSHLKYLGSYTLPFNMHYKSTTVGGLSGIDYNAQKNEYYLISDDRSQKNPARFYTAKISLGTGAIDSIYFIRVTYLKDSRGTYYPNSTTDPYHTPDPEALRHVPGRSEFIWSSEGERIVRPGRVILEDPAVTIIDTAGNFIDTLRLPSQLQMSVSLQGPRRNEVFEGLDFVDKAKKLMVSIEEPLYNDGPRTGTGDSSGITRFIEFDIAKRRPVAEFAYRINPVAHIPVPSYGYRMNGISDILSAGKNQLLVLERSFSVGRPGCSIKLFLANYSHADNVIGDSSLTHRPSVSFIAKKLLLDTDSLGIYVDNLEGVTFGPKLPDGHRTLILVSDNNFSPLQKNQFLLFEIQ